MGYVSNDGEHEGISAPELPGGLFAVAWDASGALAWTDPFAGSRAGEPVTVDVRDAIGWRGQLWKRVGTPGEEDLAAYRICEPDPTCNVPLRIERMMTQEWDRHLPSETITEVREAAAEQRAAADRLTRAVQAARTDEQAWETIGRAAGLDEDTARTRWGTTPAFSRTRR